MVLLVLVVLAAQALLHLRCEALSLPPVALAEPLQLAAALAVVALVLRMVRAALADLLPTTPIQEAVVVVLVGTVVQ